MAWKKKTPSVPLTLPGMIEALWPDVAAGCHQGSLESKDYKVGSVQPGTLKVEPNTLDKHLAYKAEQTFRLVLEIAGKNLTPKPKKVIFHLRWDAGSHTVAFMGRSPTSKSRMQYEQFKKPEEVRAWARKHERERYLRWRIEISK